MRVLKLPRCCYSVARHVSSSVSAAADTVRPSHDVVTGVIVRASASSASDVVGTLRPGDTAELLGSVPNWHRVTVVGTRLAVLVRGSDFALVYDAGSNDDLARGDTQPDARVCSAGRTARNHAGRRIVQRPMVVGGRRVLDGRQWQLTRVVRCDSSFGLHGVYRHRPKPRAGAGDVRDERAHPAIGIRHRRGSAHGYGIGKDNDGNIYRFVF